MTEENSNEFEDKSVGNAEYNDKRKHQKRDQFRMLAKPRNLKAVKFIITRWGGFGKERIDDETFEMYANIWIWLVNKGQKEDKKLDEFPVTPGGIRMTLEYMRRVLMDEMMNHTPVDFLKKCSTKMDDYLQWYESDLGRFVFRCEQLFETDRIKSQTHVVRKYLVDGIKDGDKGLIKVWAQMVGRDKGENEDEGYDPIEVVNKYLDEKGNPAKVIQIKKTS